MRSNRDPDRYADVRRSAIAAVACCVLTVLLVAVPGCVSPAKIDTSRMSFSAEPLLGKVVWNDLITEDIDAARRFYGELFGWTFESTTRPGGRPYVLAKSDGVYVAGFVPIAARSGGTNYSRWLPYISVQDVDAAVTKASASNARLAADARNVNLGRVAAIIDPEGAVIGLARSRIGDPDDIAPRSAVGSVVWTELLSNDPEAAARFYASVFGYEEQTINRRGGRYTYLTHDGKERAGILRNPTERWDPLWLTYFGVDDPSVALARAETLGGKIILSVSPEVREGTMAVVADPSGAILVLQKVKT